MKKRRYIKLNTLVLYAAVFAVVIVLAFFGVRSFSASAAEESETVLMRAIDRAIVTYYSIEGQYPATLEQLEDGYGIYIDKEKYVVDYEIFAVNVMPKVTLIKRGG